MNQDVQVQLIKMALEDKIRINRKLMGPRHKKVLRKEMEIYREILNIVKET
ncbi:TPA: hypothetical protein QCY18_003596 [Bacillus cereus]|uniref:hypothetical protein n=1 Tax=Bacillus TaxID=1386 RepID=UPI0007A7F804|nr:MULTISPECIES: hypothetical protein [Bacillus]MED2680510.1 hypothetical protein [Bacillus thuringiensis]HDR4558136.1 hypothetical protein [Bacillus luti]KYQ04251.1 hypothetical protein B4079_0795 [Bacillus cereus]MCT1379147.1 hypothetical protein [Bacillus sp. p3-SID196]MCU5473507.1 hypothetical protein [Bacillus paranthracis]